MRSWVRDVHSGGVKIPTSCQVSTKKRILAHGERHYAGHTLDIRFHGALCYIDAHVRGARMHLCRLRHFAHDRWSVAFFTYSHERYEPTVFASGKDLGTPEEALDVGAVYLA